MRSAASPYKSNIAAAAATTTTTTTTTTLAMMLNEAKHSRPKTNMVASRSAETVILASPDRSRDQDSGLETKRPIRSGDQHLMALISLGQWTCPVSKPAAHNQPVAELTEGGAVVSGRSR